MKNGPGTEFHLNGRISVNGGYKDGFLNGYCETFYDDGSRKERGHYKNGLYQRSKLERVVESVQDGFIRFIFRFVGIWPYQYR